MPLLLEAPVKHYAWGSHTALPALLGLPPQDQPWAEMWFGSHPSAPARLSDGRSLAEAAPALPFLLKLLAAAEPLSIQAHPDAAGAAAGYDAEEAAGVPLDAPYRNYRDRSAKPELLVALTPFEALVGLRPPQEVLALVDLLRLPRLAALTAALRRPAVEPGEVVSVLASFAGLPAAERAALVATVAERSAELAGPGADVEGGEADRRALAWVPRLAERFPGDMGVLAPLLLRLHHMDPGEAVFLGPGVVHAYLGGAGVEVMANSDNVLRAGLTGKHVDVGELLRVVRHDPAGYTRLTAQPTGAGRSRYAVPVSDFGLQRLVPGESAEPVRPDGPGPWILLCTQAEVDVDGLRVATGRAAFVPDGPPPAVSGPGVAFVAGPGGAGVSGG